MYDYIMGGIVITSLTVILYLLGSAVLKKNTTSMPYRLLIGYLVYSFLVAVPGILVQVLQLPWQLFSTYIVVLLISIVVYSSIIIWKEKIELLPHGLLHIIKNHWVLFAIPVILIFILLLYYRATWFNNHLDDGFYINKIATFPYTQNPFATNPSTGLAQYGLDPYTVNTGELELSVYVYLFNLTPTVFARVFMSLFHYFLFACCTYVFAEKIANNSNLKGKVSWYQYVTIIALFFGVNSFFLENHDLLFVYDSNQFTTAMYYMSSVVRTMGIMMLILPFIEKNKITIKDVLYVIGISVVLMSKSTIALPLIFLVSVAYLLVTWALQGKKYYKWILIVVLALMVLGAYLGSALVLQDFIYSKFAFDFKSIALWPSILIFILSFKYLKSPIVYKVNYIMLAILGLKLFPFVHNVYQFTTVHRFVAGRVNTTYVYTFMILSVIYIYMMAIKFKVTKKRITLTTMVMTVLLTVLSIFSFTQDGGNVVISGYRASIYNGLAVSRQNTKMVPNSTIYLGNVLEEIATSTDGDVNVIMETLVLANHEPHALAVIIRSFAPSVKSISAIGRYGVQEGNPFSSYSDEDQTIFSKFINDPEEHFDDFRGVIERFPINCIVVPTYGYGDYLQELGFDLYSEVSDEVAGVMYVIYFNYNR